MSDEKKKILLVDDDQFLLNMYAIKFRKAGYEIEAVPSGALALERLRAGMAPDAVLLDVVMPNMDGFELLTTIRKEKLSANSAYVILTNQSQPTDIEKGKQLSADGYIVKASTIPSEVVTEVKKILESKRVAK